MHLCFLVCMLCVQCACTCKGSYKCHWLAFLSYRILLVRVFLALFINCLCSVKYSDDDDDTLPHPTLH